MPTTRTPAKWITAVMALCVLAASTVLSAPSEDWEDDDYSYDKARRAVARGEALPVTEVMKHLRSKVKGDIVATEYEYEYERWVYEFKIVDPLGRLYRVHLDAATGELVTEPQD